MATAFDRDQLLAAFDQIGLAAVHAQTRLEIMVYGGSALMLASNFRFSTEDVDIAEISQPWPAWLSEVVTHIARQNGWDDRWLNEAVTSFLSPLARPDRDLVVWGTFPRASDKTGLTIYVPTARYLLALKLRALRIASYEKGSKDLADVVGLLQVLEINDVEGAIAILTEYFPKSAADAEKARFVIRQILSMERPHAPSYPRRSI
jgi:hypothetical protein